MRPKSAILLVLALGCGLIAAIGVTQVINKDSKTVAQQGDTRSIIVATQDVNLGELITPQMVKLESWPKDRVPEGALTQIEKVEGCRARAEIFQGEPILERKLLGQGTTRQTAADHIPKGYRVVGVKVDMVSGAGLIQPGDRVDVLVNVARNPQRGLPESRTQTILQDIKVFAVEDKFKVNPSDSEEDTIQAKVIQLLVTPVQAESLVLAQQLGKVQLTMRPPGGEDIIKTAGKTPTDLFGGTSVGNRGEEELGSGTTSSGNAGGILDMLNGMGKKSSQTARQLPVEKAAGIWNMRVLTGSDLTDVTLEEATNSSGEHFWRVDAGTMEPSASQPPMDVPPTEPDPSPAPGATTEPQATPPQPDQPQAAEQGTSNSDDSAPVEPTE